MDILQVIKPKAHPAKASFQTLPLVYRLGLLVTILSLLMLNVPHQTLAHEIKETTQGEFVFITNNYLDFLTEKTEQAAARYRIDQLKKQLTREQTLSQRLAIYLQLYRSPLADYAEVLAKQPHWKQIVALANAESTLCRNYPQKTANCWGVGGSDLWTMGENLGEGIMSMNNFLENHPKRSPVKYAQMTFEQMNGLYKQPPKDHWVFNAKSIYEELATLEQEL